MPAGSDELTTVFSRSARRSHLKERSTHDRRAELKNTTERIAWAGVFALFLVVRLFSSSAYIELGGDQCKYLTLGRTFPCHAVFDGSLYLLHQPLFGYSIGILATVLPLRAAGLFCSLLFSALTFVAVDRFSRIHDLCASGRLLALTYLSLACGSVVFDAQVSRIPILMCLTAASLVAFERFMAAPGRRRFLVAFAANAACLLTSDQALSVLAAEVVIFLVHRRKGRWRDLLLLVFASGLVYLIWPAVRLTVYLAYDHYPAGMDGVVERFETLPLAGLLQPNYLPNIWERHQALGTHMSVGLETLTPLRLAQVAGFLLIVGMRIGVAVVAGLLALALAAGAVRRDRDTLKLLALTVTFALPLLMGMPAWYGFGLFIPLSVLLGKGLCAVNRAEWVDRLLVRLILAASLSLAAVWLTCFEPGPASWQNPRG
ncbi:hypothetical protein ACFL59_13695, partial [Planctomycetota bacterium]